MKGFQIAGGSVPGTDHTKPGQPGWVNNQDAFAFAVDEREDYIVAAVCDGCGSSPHSEVGSRIGAQLTVKHLTDLLHSNRLLEQSPGTLLDHLETRIIRDLRDITNVLSGEFKPKRDLILSEQFLFTVVGVVMNASHTLVFAFGDGVYAVNGEVVALESENNMPAYIAYRLLQSSLDPAQLQFRKLDYLPTPEVQSVLIGTDGVADLISHAETVIPGTQNIVGPVSQFWDDPRYVGNPDAVRRRLAVLNRERVEEGHIKKGLLRDDTTLVVVRRTEDKQEG